MPTSTYSYHEDMEVEPIFPDRPMSPVYAPPLPLISLGSNDGDDATSQAANQFLQRVLHSATSTDLGMTECNLFHCFKC